MPSSMAHIGSKGLPVRDEISSQDGISIAIVYLFVQWN